MCVPSFNGLPVPDCMCLASIQWASVRRAIDLSWATVNKLNYVDTLRAQTNGKVGRVLPRIEEGKGKEHAWAQIWIAQALGRTVRAGPSIGCPHLAKANKLSPLYSTRKAKGERDIDWPIRERQKRDLLERSILPA